MPHGDSSRVTGRSFAVREYAQYLNAMSDRKYNSLRDNYNTRSARRGIESFEGALRGFDNELQDYLDMNRRAGFRSVPGPSLIEELLGVWLGRDVRGEVTLGVEQEWRQSSQSAGFQPPGGQGGGSHHGRSSGPPSHHRGRGLGGGGGPSGQGYGGYHGRSFGPSQPGGYGLSGRGGPPPFGPSSYGPRPVGGNHFPPGPSPFGHGFGGDSGRSTPRRHPNQEAGRISPAAGSRRSAPFTDGHGDRSHAGGSSRRPTRSSRAAPAPSSLAYPEEDYDDDE